MYTSMLVSKLENAFMRIKGGGLIMSTNDQSTNSIKPFGMRDKLGYMFGDFGNDFSFIFASSFLMIFYTKVLGVGPGIVALLFLTARIVDAFTDIGMGRIVDTMKPKKEGRFRFWIKTMAIPVNLASALMYLYFVKDMGETAKIIYMFVTYILWGSICYTAINIPYGSMASVMSENPKDRTELSTFRSLGASLANLTINMLVPLFIYTKDVSGAQIVIPERMTIIAIVFAILGFICHRICYSLTTERVTRPEKTEEELVSFEEMIRGIFTNRALAGLILAALFLLVAMLMNGAMSQYVFLDVFKDTKYLSVLAIINVLPTFLLAPLAPALTEKFGKKETAIVAMIIAAIAYIAAFIIRPSNPVVYLGITAVGIFGLGYFNLIVWAFITDVIDYAEVKNGRREDGTIYSIYSFARKLGQALAGGLSGFALQLIGYQSAAAAQSASVVEGVYNIATLVPAASFICVACALIFIYPLDKKTVEKNLEILAQKRNQA